MARLIDTDMTNVEVKPENGRDFKLEELYKLLDCEMIEIIHLGGHFDGQIMIIDEEGKLTGKQRNRVATDIFMVDRTWSDTIVGKALVCLDSEVL